MGQIITRKNDNGTLDLEITYGGDSAPFAGLDTSAPPMYINPGGFVDVNGFAISNQQLTAVSWYNLHIVLNGWDGNVYLGAGKLYTNSQYYNWVLAYTQSGTTAVYTIWVFKGAGPQSVNVTGQLSITSPVVVPGPATSAMAVIEVNPNYYVYSSSNWDTIYIIVGTQHYTIGYANVANPGGAPYTPALLATAIVSAINADPGRVANAATSGDGLTIDLTTIATGILSNNTNISISFAGASGSIRGVSVAQPFSGGHDAITAPTGPPSIISPLSWTTVGETLYLSGGSASVILRFAYQGEVSDFTVLTNYIGAITLGKFNNQLIAGGVTLGIGTVIQYPEMVVAWSAPSLFWQWQAVDGQGLVTGAGFNQISDISDYISGMFVANNIIVILRPYGIDYMNALQNGVIPFDFNHISNALIGEGCHDSRLATQYDQVGIFVGTTNVYEFSNQIVPIGDMVKNALMYDVDNDAVQRSSTSCPALLLHQSNTFAFFVIDYKIYVYCFNNKTWTKFDFMPGCFMYMNWVVPESSIPDYVQFQNTPISFFACSQTVGAVELDFFTYTDQVATSEHPITTAPYCIFKQEEIAFGRDITVDALLVSARGTPGQVINFSVSGILHGRLTIQSETLQNYQVFWDEQVTTVQYPQLRIDLDLLPPGTINNCVIAKIAMFGSFDPGQRPV